MKYGIWVLLLIFSLQSFSQKTASPPLLFTSSISINDFNFKSADLTPLFTSKIIGMGEATHGTHEFELIKTELAKMLISEYRYNKLLWECSVPLGNAINAFTSGEVPDSLTLVRAMKMYMPFPYSTKTVMAFFSWLKAYNQSVKMDDRVEIFGIDNPSWNSRSIMQYELKKYGTISGIRDTTVFHIIDSIHLYSNYKLKAFLWFKNAYQGSKYMTNRDSLANLCLIDAQIMMHLKKGGKRYKYREEEILFKYASGFINQFKPDDKCIIWSHNDHVSKRYSGRESLGKLLKETHDSNYKSIGFEFFEGSFMAKNPTSSKSEIDTFYVKASTKTIGGILNNENKRILGFSSLINKMHPFVCKQQTINSIGAVYSPSFSAKKAMHQERLILKKSFDYLFVVKQMLPISLL
jgi:erythromycin esterase